MARQVVLGKIAATINGYNTTEITASDGIVLNQNDARMNLSAPGIAENAREISELQADNITNKSDIALNKNDIATNAAAIEELREQKVDATDFEAHVNDNIKHITAEERDVWNNKADGTEFNNLKSDYEDTKDELARHEADTEKHTSYEEREYWNKKIDQDNLIGTDTAVPRDDWRVYSSDKVDELLGDVNTVIDTKITEIEGNITDIMATKQNKIKKSINTYPSVLLTVPGSDAAPDLVYQGGLLLGEDLSTWRWDNYIDYNGNEKSEPSYKTETGTYLIDISTIERSLGNVYYTDMLLNSRSSNMSKYHYKNTSIRTSSGQTVSKYVTTYDANDPLCFGIYHNIPLTISNAVYNVNVIDSWMSEKFNILDFQRTGYGYNTPASPSDRKDNSTLTSSIIHGFIRDLVIGQSLSFQSHFGMVKGDDMIAAVYNTYADMDRIIGNNSTYNNWKSIAAMDGSNKYILVLHDETHDNDATIYQLTGDPNGTTHTVTYQRKYSLFVRSMLTDVIGITKIADKVIFYNNDDASVLGILMPTSTSNWPEATVGSKVMTINTYDTTNDGKITGKIYEVTSINDTSGAITLGAPTNVPSLYELIKDNFINKNIIADSFGDDYGTASDGNKIPNVEAVRNFYYSHLNNDGIWDNNIYSTDKIDSFLSNKANLTDFNAHKNNTDIHISADERTKWNNKEDKSNKKSDLTVSDNISDTYYPTTKAVKEYVDYKTEFIEPYGFQIDLTEGESDLCITYIGKNKNYTPFTTNYANLTEHLSEATIDYGDWENAWFIRDIKVVRMDIFNNKIINYLNKNNYVRPEYDYDKSIDDINLSYGNYSVMIGIPTVWIKTVQVSDKVCRYYFSPVKLDDSYQALAHTAPTGEVVPYKWMSAYPITNYSIDYSNKENSIIAAQSSGSKEKISLSVLRSMLRTIAELQEKSFVSTESIHDRQLINLLLLLITRTTNMDKLFGIGGSSFATGALNDDGIFAAKHLGAGYSGQKVFGMENWWGTPSGSPGFSIIGIYLTEAREGIGLHIYPLISGAPNIDLHTGFDGFAEFYDTDSPFYIDRTDLNTTYNIQDDEASFIYNKKLLDINYPYYSGSWIEYHSTSNYNNKQNMELMKSWSYKNMPAILFPGTTYESDSTVLPFKKDYIYYPSNLSSVYYRVLYGTAWSPFTISIEKLYDGENDISCHRLVSWGVDFYRS